MCKPVLSRPDRPQAGVCDRTVLTVIEIPPGGSLSIDYSRADPGPGLAPRGGQTRARGASADSLPPRPQGRVAAGCWGAAATLQLSRVWAPPGVVPGTQKVAALLHPQQPCTAPTWEVHCPSWTPKTLPPSPPSQGFPGREWRSARRGPEQAPHVGGVGGISAWLQPPPPSHGGGQNGPSGLAVSLGTEEQPCSPPRLLGLQRGPAAS